MDFTRSMRADHTSVGIVLADLLAVIEVCGLNAVAPSTKQVSREEHDRSQLGARFEAIPGPAKGRTARYPFAYAPAPEPRGQARRVLGSARRLVRGRTRRDA